jgi:hypothetical protein
VLQLSLGLGGGLQVDFLQDPNSPEKQGCPKTGRAIFTGFHTNAMTSRMPMLASNNRNEVYLQVENLSQTPFRLFPLALEVTTCPG